ncbi:MAG: hypothetical protein KAU26_02605, partial [Methylococcales bacterium]|nr:hypothetical protein [Methylococcales bacterium]
SYFEWVQNHANEQWTLETVHEKLQTKMAEAVDLVFDCWQNHSFSSNGTLIKASELNFRTIALVISIKRVAEATLLRGVWP